MAKFEIRITHGYLMGTQKRAKNAIEILCKKESLSSEDAQAIRLLTDVIDLLRVDTIDQYQKGNQGRLSEDYSQHVKDLPHG